MLPLNVPAHKPLLYCNASEIAQAYVQYDSNIYSCVNESIAISCPRDFASTTVDECLNKTMMCDQQESLENLYCTNATLLSRANIVCNSTTVLNGTLLNETTTILNCYQGELPERLTAFIPTTTTEAPITTTTEKQLSMGAKIHVFFLKLIGKGHVMEKVTTTASPLDDVPLLVIRDNETAWVPEALTIPPEPTTTTTTEAPHYYAMEIPDFNSPVDGPVKFNYRKVDGGLESALEILVAETGTLPPGYVRLPVTTEMPKTSSDDDFTTETGEETTIVNQGNV